MAKHRSRDIEIESERYAEKKIKGQKKPKRLEKRGYGCEVKYSLKYLCVSVFVVSMNGDLVNQFQIHLKDKNQSEVRRSIYLMETTTPKSWE